MDSFPDSLKFYFKFPPGDDSAFTSLSEPQPAPSAVLALLSAKGLVLHSAADVLAHFGIGADGKVTDLDKFTKAAKNSILLHMCYNIY